MLVPLTVAFLVGLLCGSALSSHPLFIVLLLILAAVSVTWLEGLGVATPRQGVLLYGLCLAGVLYWAVFLWAVGGSRLASMPVSEPVKITGMVVEPVKPSPGRAGLLVDVTQAEAGATVTPFHGTIRVTWREPDVEVRRGDRIAFTARLHPPGGTLNPGGFDYAEHLRRQGIDAVASLSGSGQVVVLGAAPGLSRWGFWRVIDTWRDRIRQAADQSLTGTARNLYLSLIVGQSGELASDLRDAFMATGTVHILSISGSHFGLIALLTFGVVRGCCRRLPAVWLLALSRRVTPTRLAAFATVAPVVFYALLAGAETATVRSLVMLLVFLLAVWLGRDGQLLPALAAAALLILAHDPRAVFDISFQLSYCSVLAIAVVLPQAKERCVRPGDRAASQSILLTDRLLVWLYLYGSVTGAVTLATAPLVAYHFNQIAWLGLAANLVVVPLAGLALVPVGLGSAVWVLLSGSGTLPAAWLNQTLLDLLSQAVQRMALVPGAVWHVASPTVFGICVFYALLYGATRCKRSEVSGLSCCLGVALLLCWWAWSPRGMVDGDAWRVTFLDVGQGDACVLELPDGQTIVIDGGAAYETLDMGRAVVGPYLWDRGIRRLDHVIATHPQLDHVGGLAWLVRTFNVDRFWSNGISREELFYERLREALRRRGQTETVAMEGQDMVTSGPCRLQVLNPPHRLKPSRDGSGSPALDVETSEMESGTAHGWQGMSLNNLSVVTRLVCGSQAVLFAADVETEALARLRDSRRLAARVVKVPHHGASSSLDRFWIERVGADMAVISVGRRNPYGHPAPAVLSAYEQRGAKIFRTDRQGAVWIEGRVSSDKVRVAVASEGLPQPVRFGAAMGVGLDLQAVRKYFSELCPKFHRVRLAM